MAIREYLRENQPVIYKTLSNAIKQNQLAHAYLIIGENGSPLKEIAFHLAKTLVCENPDPFACEQCPNCKRIDDGNYADLIFIENATITKSDVEEISSLFSKTPLEKNGKQIYIIHLVENMRNEAINSLLKFLEEPPDNTYAFLTTQNETKVLPTILSRTQKLVLKTINRNKVIENSINAGVCQKDAELLSFFYNDTLTIQNSLNDENYIKIKEALDLFVNSLNDGLEETMYQTEKNIAPVLNTKELTRMFLDLVADFFQQLNYKKYGKNIILKNYDNIINEVYTKLPHIDQSLVEIMSLKSLIKLNLNTATLLDHLVILIFKEVK